MSSRAKRLERSHQVEPFDWGGTGASRPAPSWSPALPLATPVTPPSADAIDAVQRDAFAKGYAQGERAGNEAAVARADAMLRRLAQTIEELQALRSEVIHRTERQVVELALAIARKVIQRETTIDTDLLMAMARVALDRLADTTTASIRLHPDDHAAVVGRSQSGVAAAGHAVQIVADGAVRRGGCVVRSDVGAIDIGVSAQLDELTRALLGDEASVGVGVEVHLDDADRRR
jgi:flagellar biosynthesis/type III secretory pathway protein FliH